MALSHHDSKPTSIEDIAISINIWQDIEDPDHEARWQKFNSKYPIIGKMVLDLAYKKYPDQPINQSDLINTILDIVNIIITVESNKNSL